MRIVIGADHAGFGLKGPVVEALKAWGHEVEDVGTHTGERVDFPDVAQSVCSPILEGTADRGIMVCGTGIGACMAANKIPGIRAALCHDMYSAHQCVEHDDANVLCVGARILGPALAEEVIEGFVQARFTGEERHARRLGKLNAIESEFSG